MSHDALILLGTAATLGAFHTLVGVDHTLPFMVLARVQGWTLRKLWLVTTLCGLAHILSSVAIGAVGIGLGVGLEHLEWIESSRGGIAARLLIGFGLAYMVWGIYRSLRGKQHSHPHAHHDGTVHKHQHEHARAHVHVHHAPFSDGPLRGAAGDLGKTAKVVTVLGLFVVFILGPCEVLIPLLLAPAFEHDWLTVVGVVGVFGGATLATMLGLVTVGWFGMQWRGIALLERHLHALAGFAIVASGLCIELLGI
jgi:hypothetical protein